MAEQKTEHPPEDDLAAFALGHLRGPERDEIERHVSQCDTCCQVLGSVAADTLVEQLRASDSPSDATAIHAAAAESPSQDSDEPPPELKDHSRYRVLRHLGRGGMGEVFQAEHRLMDRSVALKLIHRNFTNNPQAVERFRREVRAAAKLSHPNIVIAHDAEQAGDLHFLIMEYVDGASLDRVVARHGPLPVVHACNYVRQAALGLQHAHEHGMVHRDIKPQNLMLARKGRVKVLDFGLARLAVQDRDDPADDARASADTGLTVAGTTMGTPDYMAPEQIRDSRRADVRSDIYSLGCTFYFLLTGQPPFAGDSVAEKLQAHLNQQPPGIDQFRSDVPPNVTQILDRMLAKDANDRFQTPAELAEALRPFSKRLDAEREPVVSRKERPPAVAANGIGKEAETLNLPSVATTPVPRIHARKTTGRKTRGGWPRRYRWHLLAAAIVMLGATVWLAAALSRNGSESPRGAGPAETDQPGDGAVSSRALHDQGRAAPADVPAGGGRTVLIVVPYENFWYQDYAPVRQRLEAAGFAVKIGSSRTGTARSAAPSAHPVPVDVTVEAATAEDYVALVFVGSSDSGSIEYLGDTRSGRAARKLIQAMLKSNRYVTSLCGGTAVLADAGVLRGKSVADGEYVPEHIKQRSGAAGWEPQHVVQSSQLVLTGGDFQFANEFADALVALLRGQ